MHCNMPKGTSQSEAMLNSNKIKPSFYRVMRRHQSVDQLVGRLVSWSVGRLVSRSVGQSIEILLKL